MCLTRLKKLGVMRKGAMESLMKKYGRALPIVLVVVSICYLPSFAHIHFSSPNSAISIAPGTQLFVDTLASMRIDGTLIKNAGASITGNNIHFSHGIFNTDGVDVLLTASFSPEGKDTINLWGDGKLVAPPGYVVEAINVRGANNRIEGQPFLQQAIYLHDGDAEVALALENTLDKNIILNGGKIYLDSDLSLGDDAIFSGSGTITVSGHHLTLGGLYTQLWNGSLTFDNATDLMLSGSVMLEGTWTFSGISVINGNGSIIDLSNGGSIIVEHGSCLVLNDLTLTGIGYEAGNLVLNGVSSQLLTNQATIRAIGEVTTSAGNVYVQGPTTFIMSNNSWNFTNNGKLTVDGTTLWVDQLNAQSFFDGIKAPLPLYGTAGIEIENIASNITSGNLQFLNNGIVRMVSQGSGSSIINPLSGSLTTTVMFSGDIFLDPKDYIYINGNIMIDGGGSAIHFSNPTTPLHSQLTIAPGKILTLRNVRLLNLSASTIDFRNASRMNIAQNVLFELSQDITFSSGLIRLIGNGLSSDIWTVRGLGGQRKMSINPMVATTSPKLQLGTNTLLLENIELSGFNSISHVNSTISGAVALTNDSRATLSTDSAMNFVIEGSGNELVLQKDGINLSGNISYGGQTDNELHVRFARDTIFDNQLQAQYGALLDNPILILSGDPGVYLSSFDGGLARIFFDDPSLSIVNAGTNAFVVDAESYLECINLEILMNPIKQSSSIFSFKAAQLSGLQIDPSFIRGLAEATRAAHILPTALHMRHQQEKKSYADFVQQALVRHKEQQKQETLARAKGNRQKKQPYRNIVDLGFDIDFDDMLTRAGSDSYIPTTFDQHYSNMNFVPTTPLSGNLEFDNATVSNVSVSSSVAFNLVLKNRSQFYQGSSDIVLDSNHYINIVGEGNVINVSKSMTIANNLFFEEGGEVTFNFINNGEGIPTLTFAARSTLDIPRNSVLRFSGNGQVIFGNGATIAFQGLKSASGIVSSRPKMIITEGAVMTPAQSARVTIKGIGRVEITQRGGIEMTKVGALIFGGASTYLPRTSDLELYVGGTGFISLAPTAIPQLDEQLIESKGVARVSFQRTTVYIDIENSGVLSIGDNGRFEVNVEGTTLKTGKIESLFFHQNCLLGVTGSGCFSIGSNGLSQSLAMPLPFYWGGRLMGKLSGDGYIRYVDIDAGKSFTGKLSLYADPFKTIPEITSEGLASLLVQLASALKVSTVYINQDGNRALRTVKGVSVLLQEGDVIVSDDWNQVSPCDGRTNPFYGYVNGFDSNGLAFRYTPDGNRI